MSILKYMMKISTLSENNIFNINFDIFIVYITKKIFFANHTYYFREFYVYDTFVLDSK